MGKKTSILPRWLNERYLLLWNELGDKSFTKKDAISILTKLNKYDTQNINVILSKLKKANLLVINFDEVDHRKRIYNLISEPDMAGEMLVFNKNGFSLSDIENKLDDIIKLLRGPIPVGECIKLLQLILFFKKINLETIKEKPIVALYSYLGNSEELSWNSVKNSNDIAQALLNAFNHLQIEGINFKELLYGNLTRILNSEIIGLILHTIFDIFDTFENYSENIYSDLFEYLLEKRIQYNKEYSANLSPKSIIKLVLSLTKPRPEQTLYDPCCGLGNYLIESYEFFKSTYGEFESKNLKIFGQEINHEIYAFCKINCFLHDVKANIILDDSLISPGFSKNGQVVEFDFVFVNPPWNQRGIDFYDLIQGKWGYRFKYGVSPKSSADWMWIQHVLASTKNDGKAFALMSAGCLFRSGRELSIRKKIIEADYIETIIYLPTMLMINTSIPSVLIIFNKKKENNRKNKIRFIDASEEYSEKKRNLMELSKENIKTIVEMSESVKDRPNISKDVSFEEIVSKSYNLSINLYVFPGFKYELVDIKKEWDDIKEIDLEIEQLNKKLNKFMEDLNNFE